MELQTSDSTAAARSETLKRTTVYFKFLLAKI